MSQSHDEKAIPKFVHDNILDAIGEYLTQNKRDPILIQQFIGKRRGVCQGLACLNYYLYKVEKREKKPGRDRDDLAWFQKTVTELLQRHKNKQAFPTNKEDAFYQDIERLISLVIGLGGYYKSPFKKFLWGENFLLMEDTAGFAAEVELIFAATLTKNDFTKEIIINGEKTTFINEFVREGKMTLVSAGVHATYLTKEDGVLYFFDANHVEGKRIPIISEEKLIEKLLSAHRHTEQFEFLIADLKERELKAEEKVQASKPYPKMGELLPQLDAILSKKINTPDLVDPKFSTLLLKAVNTRNSDLVRVCLKYGADINQFSEDKYLTALISAVHDGNLKIVELLLLAGADPNAKNIAGMTPIYMSAFRGHTDIAKLLLSWDADPNTKTDTGWTPLHMTLFLTYRDPSESNLEMLKIFKAKDVLINALSSKPAQFKKLGLLAEKLNNIYNSYKPPTEVVKKLNKHILDALTYAMNTGDFELAFKNLCSHAIQITNDDLKKNKKFLSALFKKHSDIPDQISNALIAAGVKLEKLPDDQIQISKVDDDARNCLESFRRIIYETDFVDQMESKEAQITLEDGHKKFMPQVIQAMWAALKTSDETNPLASLKTLNIIAENYLTKTDNSKDTISKFCEFVSRQASVHIEKGISQAQEFKKPAL